MPRPTSFRLSEDLLARLDEEAVSSNSSVSGLVTSLLDEGLKTRRFPGIVFRDGPTGRRAALADGPDVWEVVRALQLTPGKGEKLVTKLADKAGLSARQIRLSVDYYSVFSEEIDERIAEDERSAERLRGRVQRRDRLVAG